MDIKNKIPDLGSNIEIYENSIRLYTIVYDDATAEDFNNSKRCIHFMDMKSADDFILERGLDTEVFPANLVFYTSTLIKMLDSDAVNKMFGKRDEI